MSSPACGGGKTQTQFSTLSEFAIGKKVITNISTISPYTGDRALTADMNPLQRWVGIATKNAYFTIDLAAAYFFSSYTASSMTAATGAAPQWVAPGYCNSGYKLEGSNDNITFTLIDSASSGNVSTFTRALPQITIPYRYVRVTPFATTVNPQLASVVNFQLSENPILLNLISSCILCPGFSPFVTSYTSTVDSSVASIASIGITPFASNSGYIIKINGNVVTSAAIATITLVYGANTITITHTSPIDGVTTTYTLVVTRPAPSKYLSNITMSYGTNNVAIAPAFSGKATYAYTASVPYGTTSVMVTPISEQATETITVNGLTVASGTASIAIALNYGSGNIIRVVSTASDGTSVEYDITVTRAGNPYLSNLALKSGHSTFTLSPIPFSPQQNPPYTLSVSGVLSVTFTPTAVDSLATITLIFKGITVNLSNNTASPTQSLDVGSNAFEIDVKSSDGLSSMKYNITITRTS